MSKPFYSRKLHILILLTIIFSLSACFSDKNGKIKLLHFSSDISSDATPFVLKELLDKENEGVSKITFEKGEYHFYPDKGLEKFCYISNHNDVVIKTAFPLSQMKGLTIDGQGATFVFHGKMIPFLIDGSTNIAIKNLSIDWEVPFHSEALIVANDLENKTFDLKIAKEYPYEIRNGQLYFIKESYEHNLGQAILYDPERRAIAYNTEDYTPLTIYNNLPNKNTKTAVAYKYKVDSHDPVQNRIAREYALRVEELEPGLVRVYNHRKKIPPVGKVLVCKGEQHANRLAPAIRITNTNGFNAKNVKVHHAGGMGLIAENSSDLILDRFDVTPSRGRMVSTTADATHFVGCRGRIELKKCIFKNQLDDATNVHGTYQEVVDVIDEFTIGVRMGHYQQQGFVIGKPKDKVGLVRLKNSFFPYDSLTIKSVQKLNSRYQKITFNESLPASLESGDLIENLSAYPEMLLVEDCIISNNRARGLLLSTPNETVIRNNFFSTEMEALLIPVESGHWFESGNGANISIIDNTFQDCNHSGYNRGVIRFVTDDDNHNIAFNNINIKGNTFNHFDNLILEVANTDGLVFQENVITNSKTFPKRHNQKSAFRLKSSRNIQFKKNTYEGDAETVVEVEGNMQKVEFN
ncbi:Right handed beta helix region [Zobellia uliginosa]|uniref:Right handed beta helix region n=2 Tax=Zobellia uliginosa TaxID=143224 RepID=A0ABY1L1L8_9FLAO|nr:Right handed beta helix region [Zobellia uliginosa]